MPIVNLTDAEYQAIFGQKTLADQLLGNPFVWIAIVFCILIVVFFKFFNKPAGDPSTKPFWGRQVRRELMQKEYKKRLDFMGKRCNIHLEKGISRIGIITAIEHDKQLFTKVVFEMKTRQRTVLPDYYYRVDRFKIRKFGVIALALSLLGFGFQYMSITPEAYRIRRERNGKLVVFNIDPTIHLINDSEVWTISDKRAVESNHELLIKADDENIHGSAIDYLRRLAVHSPAVSSTMEKMSHEAKIKEEERMKRNAPYR
jgi:hypothetical protein